MAGKPKLAPVSTTARPCKAKCKSGEPCKANALPGSDFCTFHDPAMVEARRQGRSKGGYARHGRTIAIPDESQQIEQLTAETILHILIIAVNDCLAMERSLARARTLAALAQAAVKTIESVELESRIAALEAVASGKITRMKGA